MRSHPAYQRVPTYLTSTAPAHVTKASLSWSRHGAGIPKGGRATHTDLDARSWTSETCSGVTLQSSSHWAAGA